MRSLYTPATPATLATLATSSRIRLSLWGLFVAILLGSGVMQWQQGYNIRADVLALLPAVQQQPDVAQAVKQTTASYQQQLVLAFLPNTVEQAAQQHPITLTEFQNWASQLQDQLDQSGLFSGTPELAPAKAWFDARYQLLSPASRTLIQQQPERLLAQTTATLYSPGAGAAPLALDTDPLGLANRYQQYFAPANFEPVTDNIFLAGDNRQYLLGTATLKVSAFDAEHASQLIELLTQLQDWAATQSGQLLSSGVPVFAAHGAQQARTEISLFGSISLFAVVALLIAVFASVRPLFGTVVCISTGLVAALLTTHWLFGEVHLLTLVFGAGLIGISVDYALHLLCDGYHVETHVETSRQTIQPTNNKLPSQAMSMTDSTDVQTAVDIPASQRSLRSVAPGITLAMATSVLAFLSFLLTPFPGLQQISVFAASGLISAWFTVIALLPALGWQPDPHHGAARRMLVLLDMWGRKWPLLGKKALGTTGILLLLVSVIGLWQLRPNDNVQLLQSAPENLLAQDTSIRPLLPFPRASQFFLIDAADPQTLLEHEAELLSRLSTEDTGTVMALSTLYPSVVQQQRDYQLLRHHYYEQPRLRLWYQSLGVSPAVISANRDTFDELRETINLPEWVAGAPPHLQALWLGCDSSACRSIVSLQRVGNKAAMQAISKDLQHVTWVDQVASISLTLQKYRQLATRSLLTVYSLAAGLLMMLFGWRAGLRIVAVPGAAAVLAVAISTLLGNPFSLFSLLALMVVVGISLDYAVFYHLHGRYRASTSLAISLSTLTTVLAFGLLAFSSTAVVHTFGITLFIGISCAFLLAPFAATTHNNTVADASAAADKKKDAADKKRRG